MFCSLSHQRKFEVQLVTGFYITLPSLWKRKKNTVLKFRKGKKKIYIYIYIYIYTVYAFKLSIALALKNATQNIFCANIFYEDPRACAGEACYRRWIL